jgi:hypothetical protein
VAWPAVPEVAGKRLTRAEASSRSLSLAFADGSECTVEPTGDDEHGMIVKHVFADGDPVERLPAGVTVRRGRWVRHWDMSEPWGLRLDLDTGESLYVYLDGHLRVTGHFESAARMLFTSADWRAWQPFVSRVGGLIALCVIWFVAVQLGLPNPLPWLAGGIGVAIVLFCVGFFIACIVGGIRAERRAVRRIRSRAR